MKVRCAYCKKYIDRTSALRIGVSNFCDYTCSNEKKYLQKQKKNTPDAESPGEDQESLRQELRKQVLTKDGFRCRLCGGNNNLAIHHVIYRSQGGEDEISNLITLCNYPCHLDIVHGNKRKYQRLCLKIIWQREIDGDRSTLISELERLEENARKIV